VNLTPQRVRELKQRVVAALSKTRELSRHALQYKPGVKLHSKEQNTILLELEADGKIVIRRRSDGAWFVRLAS